jgi:hypothetical protein
MSIHSVKRAGTAEFNDSPTIHRAAKKIFARTKVAWINCSHLVRLMNNALNALADRCSISQICGN